VGTGAGERILLLLSGGLDSACCLSFLRSKGHEVESLFVDYGQLASEAELNAAQLVAAHFNSKFSHIKVSHERQLGQGEIVGRNATLIFAALLSSSTLPSSICIGVHGGTPYFDCTEVFCSDMNRMVSELSNGRTGVLAPFVTWHKADIIEFALDRKIPIVITHSCEAGNSPCGKCASCRDRALIQCL